MQIYTNFESNSQQLVQLKQILSGCFRCKFTQILKAIHNKKILYKQFHDVVSDANLHKFWKQFTTSPDSCRYGWRLFPMQIYTNFESNSQPGMPAVNPPKVVSDANLHKFWKQFTTLFALLVH